MPTRYADEPEYGREPARGIRRERDGRDVRERETVRDIPRERRTMEVEQPRLARMPEPDLIRSEQQRVANSGVPRQQDARPVRAPVPPRGRDDDDMMYDARPAQYAPAREQREPTARRNYEGEFDDMPPQARPIVDPGRSRDEPRPPYAEYFLPGEGIDREVIQTEICRYLGQDATCKPGAHHDGRRGFIIRGYRALTTEMVRSLREDSAKYAREKENAARRNRQPASFATIRDTVRYGGDEMMVDTEPEDRYASSRYDEPRARGPPPAVSSYLPDAGYPPSYMPVTQPPPSGIDPRLDPRYIPQSSGNLTPPSSRTPGHQVQAYPPTTTRASVASIPAGVNFGDSRMSNVRDSGYGSYQSEPRSRHR